MSEHSERPLVVGFGTFQVPIFRGEADEDYTHVAGGGGGAGRLRRPAAGAEIADDGA